MRPTLPAFTHARAAALALPLLAASFLASCGGESAPVAEAPEHPTLVVLVSVDQLRADLLDRYDSLFTGGFRRLRDQGHVFDGASHRHAHTETAAGHATLATGAYPSHSGIVANNWYERRPDGSLVSVYAVQDTTVAIVGFPEMEGRSPANLLRDGLADWILAADTAARVLSVSKKDRAAITLGGRTRDGRAEVYWLNVPGGRFVSSTWYADGLPAWVERFNRERMPAFFADTIWTEQVPEAARVLARPDSAPYEADGVHVAFPHLRSGEARDMGEAALRGWTEDTPFLDRAVLALVEDGLGELQLGRRGVTDYLGVSFSQTDYVGHTYGPLSQEQLDNLLRLDQVLGQLLTLLDARVGEGRWVLGLSADHGVLTMPEYLATEGLPGHRTGRAWRDEMARQVQAAMDEGGDDEAQVRAAAIRRLEALPYVADVVGPAELQGEPADSFVALYQNSYRPERLAGMLAELGLEVRPDAYTLVTSSAHGTSHGTPYWYDRSVPFILDGAGVDAGHSSEGVFTVDLAPSLAALAGIQFPGDLDGRPVGGGK